ncbi:MAG: amino acid permease [Janthinobacterium lividum]
MASRLPAPSASLARPLGFAAALALVVGNLIGSGIFLLPAALAPFGANALAGWCVSIAGGTCLAWVFARLGATLPLAGGPYAFARAAFGPAAGFAVAWSYWVMIWVGTGAVAVAAVSNASLVVPGLRDHPGAAGLVLVWIVTAVNVRGVALAGRVQLVTMALKLVPLVGVVLVGAWLLVRGVPIVPGPATPLASGPIVAAAAITFWSFLGVESATVPADKVRDPRRTVPRATMAGVGIAGAAYLLVSATIMAFAPAAATAASPAPVAAFLGRWLGGGVGGAVALFACVSAIGAMNGFLLMAGELPWAMARGGVFPRWFAAESARGTPARALVVSAVLVTLVVLANTARSAAGLFAFVASVSVAAGLVAYMASALAAVRLLPTERGTSVVALVAAGFAGWMFWGLGARADAWGLALLVAGAPIYLASRRPTKGSGSGSGVGDVGA